MLNYSFLSGGPSLRYQPPREFELLPVLYSPLSVDKSFARSLVYYPSPFDEEILQDLETNMVLVDDPVFTSHGEWDGYHEESVGQTHIRWQLKSGGLYTHLRDEDQLVEGSITFQELFDGVEVVETDANPIVLTSGRLSVEALSKPGYEEYTDFVKLAQGTTRIIGTAKVRRPGWLRPSVHRTETGHDGAVVHERGVTRLIDIRLRGVGDADETVAAADELARSIQAMR